MTDQERADLEAIGGKRLVGLVEKQGQDRTKTLEGLVDYKACSTEKKGEDTVARLQAVADMIEEEEAKTELLNVIATLQAEQMPAEGEAPAEEAPAVPAPLAEGETQTPQPPMMMGESEEDEEEEETPMAGEPKKSLETPITRAEIVEAMKLLGDQVRDEVLSGLKEVVQTSLAPVEQRLQAVETGQASKQAERQALTPAASLRDLLAQSRARIDVKAEDPLAGQKPQETPVPPAPGVGGLPSFLASLIGGGQQ